MDPNAKVPPPPSSSSSAGNTQELSVEPISGAVPKAVENAKLKPKIMQIFLEDRATQKMKIVVLKSNDRVWNLMDSVGADRIRFKTRLFAGEVELTDEPGKTLQDAGIPDNSTVHYLLEEQFIPSQHAPAPPQQDLIPCDICHGSYPISEFQQHAPCFRDAPQPQQHHQQQPSSQSVASPPPADGVPCERCQKLVSFAQYMDHINTCGFT